MVKENKTLIKMAYFDEQAAMDLLEVIEGGMTTKIVKEIVEKNKGIDVNGNFGHGFGSLFKLKLEGSIGRNKKSIIENQLTTSLISAFLSHAKENKIKLRIISDCKLFIKKDTQAYYKSILPITKMIEDFNKIDTIDEETKSSLDGINVSKLDDVINSMSGYYEIEAVHKNEKKILRFNIDGIRNNYNLVDLTKMELTFYGVLVGKTENLDISIQNYIDKISSDNETIRDSKDIYDKITKPNEEYEIIDVILAGIEV